MRAYHPTFNVTFIKLCIKVSRVFTFPPKFTTQEREREKKQIKVDFSRAKRAVREEKSRAELLRAHLERERGSVCVVNTSSESFGLKNFKKVVVGKKKKKNGSKQKTLLRSKRDDYRRIFSNRARESVFWW